MRCLLPGLLLPGILMASDFHIDHVTVAGRNIRKMQAALSAIGIASVYGGPHTDGVTEMALVSFPDGSYLECIALQPGAPPNLVDHHVWAGFLRGDAGPSAWAVREPNMSAEVQRLRAAGVPVSEPQPSGRKLPDGVQLRWETSSAGTEPRGTFFPFLIHDFTPREQRAYPEGKPVTRDFRGISSVVIASRDLDAAVHRYRVAYGLPEPTVQADPAFGARIAIMKGSPVILAQPLSGDSWLGKRLQQFGEIPCAFVLAVEGSPHWQAASASTWSGRRISWFDAEKLGWWLGFETAK